MISLLLLTLCGVSQAWTPFNVFRDQTHHTGYNKSIYSLYKDPSLKKITPFTDKDGFFLKEHIAKTEDSYLLTMHQLGRNDCTPSRSILIMHGLLAASDSWLLQGPNKDIAYLLAAACYDVWLGNLRGNFYSRHNTKISPKKLKFWDFSFDEMGRMDAPAMINKIEEVTGRKRVTVLTHSMGTVVFLAMASTRPEYNQRVDAAFLMSPVALMPPADQSPFFVYRVLTKSSPFIYRTGKRLHIVEVLPRKRALTASVRKLCNPGLSQNGCLKILGDTFGEHRENLDLSVIGDYMTTLISGTSLKNLYHLTQLANSNGKFKMFNYGKKKNLQIYGTLDPPDYPLHLVTVPVFLINGNNDALLTNEVVEKLAKKLPNVVDVHVVQDPLFTHLDFIWGLDAKKVLYNRLMRQIASIGQFPEEYDIFNMNFGNYNK